MRFWYQFLKVIVGPLLIFAVFLWLFILSPDYNVFAGTGESMSPTLKSGDLLIFKSPGETIKPGAIIVYHLEDEVVVHRVVEVNGEKLKTKGDGNSWIDPWQVSVSDVDGVYLFRISYLGSFSSLIKKNCWMK